jgi:hypothetical protein
MYKGVMSHLVGRYEPFHIFSFFSQHWTLKEKKCLQGNYQIRGVTIRPFIKTSKQFKEVPSGYSHLDKNVSKYCRGSNPIADSHIESQVKRGQSLT